MNCPTRRDILRYSLTGAGAAAYSALFGSCASICDYGGRQLYRNTDGKLLPAASEYFTALQQADSLSEELADLINEALAKEFPNGIKRNYEVSYHDKNDPDLKGREGRIVDGHCILLANTMQPCRSLGVLAHEIGHQFMGSPKESVPELMTLRISTMANEHFPDFGAGTNYLAWAAAHGTTLEEAAQCFGYELQSFPPPPGPVPYRSNREEHAVGALMALLALNHTNGSFADAHNALKNNHGLYQSRAHEFTDACVNAQNNYGQVPDVTKVEWNQAAQTIEERTEPSDYPHIALYSLLNMVTHQILGNITDTAAKQGMKQRARITTGTNNADPSQGKPPSFTKNSNQYKEGFEQNDLVPRLPFIIIPPGYDYSIQKGL